MSNYKVHVVVGNFAGSVVYEDAFLSRALAFVRGNHDEGRFAIMLPSGEWYQSEDRTPVPVTLAPPTTEDRVIELVKWADRQPPETFK